MVEPHIHTYIDLRYQQMIGFEGLMTLDLGPDGDDTRSMLGPDDE